MEELLSVLLSRPSQVLFVIPLQHSDARDHPSPGAGSWHYRRHIVQFALSNLCFPYLASGRLLLDESLFPPATALPFFLLVQILPAVGEKAGFLVPVWGILWISLWLL